MEHRFSYPTVVEVRTRAQLPAVPSLTRHQAQRERVQASLLRCPPPADRKR
jgi:hypothetical protein